MGTYFLPGESHGQRSLVGPGPQGGKRGGHDLVTQKPQPPDPLLENQAPTQPQSGRIGADEGLVITHPDSRGPRISPSAPSPELPGSSHPRS